MQFLGAFAGLSLAYACRVSLFTTDVKFTLYPDQNPFFPPILGSANGQPAYGQVFLAETIGTMFFVMLYLTGKYEISSGKDHFAMIVCIIIGWIGLYTCFANVSGGIFNPAIALAQIIWQNMTYFHGVGI